MGRVPGSAGDRALVVDDTNRNIAPTETAHYRKAVEVPAEHDRARRLLARSSGRRPAHTRRRTARVPIDQPMHRLYRPGVTFMNDIYPDRRE